MATLLLAVFLSSGIAWAARPGESQYRIRRSGDSRFGVWIAYKENPEPGRYWQFLDWLLGYLIAYSRWVEIGSGAVTKSNDQGATEWMDVTTPNTGNKKGRE